MYPNSDTFQTRYMARPIGDAMRSMITVAMPELSSAMRPHLPAGKRKRKFKSDT